MPVATSGSTKQRFEITKFLPVLFVFTNIVILYLIYLFCHSIPLLSNPESRDRGVTEVVIFNIVTLILIICYINCILVHPGTIPDQIEDACWEYIPKAKAPEVNNAGMREMKHTGDRRHCKWCAKYKPDRCHHCRVCRICVLKMDHHCPWIYNCVGFKNHKYFFLLLFYSTVDCHFLLWTMLESVINAVDDGSSFFLMFFLLFGEILASIVGLIVTCFLGFHIWLMFKAMTTIEWCEKSTKSDGSNSSVYNRGMYGNLQAVMGDSIVFWLCPWSPPSGNGLYFSPSDMSFVQDGENICWSRQNDQAKARHSVKKIKKFQSTGSASAESNENENAVALEKNGQVASPQHTFSTLSDSVISTKSFQ